jgi:hypothetical protein
LGAYPDRVKVDDAGNIAAKAEMHDEATPKATEATEAKAVLQARLDAAERLLDDRERTIDDLRHRLDEEGEERRKLTALLTDQRGKLVGVPADLAERGVDFRKRLRSSSRDQNTGIEASSEYDLSNRMATSETRSSPRRWFQTPK